MQNLINEENGLRQLVEAVLGKAKQMGATAAEVGSNIDAGFSTNVRMGEVETLEYQRDKGLGVTVYFGKKKGSASTSDTSEDSINKTLQAACDIAKYTAEDPFSGLADKALMAFDYPDLDLYHPWDIEPQDAIAMATECEAKAMRGHKKIVNSEGASVSTHEMVHAYGNSLGFLGSNAATRHSLHCIVMGKDGNSMQRDYDYTVARDAADLDSIDVIANKAAEKTLSRLNAKRVKTQKAPVIFRADVAKTLISGLISAISGSNLYRESSYLLNSVGEKLLPSQFSLTEHPHLKKGLGSAPFDHDGLATHENTIVDKGVLQHYVLSAYSARKLGLVPTANAGGVHNLKINTGNETLQEIIASMDKALLVTELIGPGVNIVTGDYSRGVVGFWIEKGEIIHPVEEITIAGNLREMLGNMVKVGNDVDKRGNILTGSILLEEMMIAGE